MSLTTACIALRQADYAEERLDAREEFEEELNQALYIRKMIDTGMHDRALERLMASTEARKGARTTRLSEDTPRILCRLPKITQLVLRTQLVSVSHWRSQPLKSTL